MPRVDSRTDRPVETRGAARPDVGNSACDHRTRARRRIAYQGEPGANSHIVCKLHYPDWEPVPCASFEDVFAAVEGGDAELAMIPIDNSIAGRVADIHHFLPDSDLHIIGEHFLRIQFALMALPGATLDTIRTVHSHVHALGQCRKVIREHGLHAGDLRRHRRRRPRGGRVRRPDPGRDLAAARGRDLRARGARSATSRTRSTTPPGSWCSPASSSRRAPGNGPGRHQLHLQRAQPAGRALQGARRLRDQRRQHDQAGELHGRRALHRHPVPRRGRRAPRRTRR